MTTTSRNIRRCPGCQAWGEALMGRRGTVKGSPQKCDRGLGTPGTRSQEWSTVDRTQRVKETDHVERVAFYRVACCRTSVYNRGGAWLGKVGSFVLMRSFSHMPECHACGLTLPGWTAGRISGHQLGRWLETEYTGGLPTIPSLSFAEIGFKHLPLLRIEASCAQFQPAPPIFRAVPYNRVKVSLDPQSI
jgi:hypothetical protein